MRTMIEREEEEAADSAVTLSTATLLGIFFGLVLVCGVFFGFGYSIGRRGTENPNAAANTTPSQPADKDETSAAPAAKPAPKPSAMQTLQTASAESSPQDDASNTVTQPLERASAAPTAATVAPPPIPRPARAVAIPQPARAVLTPASLPVSPTPVATAGNAGIMVQIAAVSHQEDADALIAGLRKHGYSVSARNEPQDKLLHVQVGPFANRDAARAMRAKLSADGYNAILKQ